jgi:NADH-quinone oxidoreductase subunit L
MGGLFSKMKTTAITFLIGSLAISGIPPLSGFFSKDEILVSAFTSGHSIIFWVLVVTSLLTSFYMFRLFALAFLGSPRKDVHAHESPLVMTVPLSILAFFAAFLGLAGSPFLHHWFQTFISLGHHGEISTNVFVVICSITAALGGSLLAIFFYHTPSNIPIRLGKIFKPLYKISINKFWFDEFYDIVLIRPFKVLAEFFFTFDKKVVDGLVNQTAVCARITGSIKRWVDERIVDGAVNGAGTITRFFGRVCSGFQTGFIQNYLFVLVLGIIFTIIIGFYT